MDERYKISTPQDAVSLVMMEMAYLDAEQPRVLLLDARGQLVEKVSLYQRADTSSVLRGAKVFCPTILLTCPGLILCYNHPSSDPTASPEDREVTRQLVEAGRLLEVELVDHIIIGHPHYVSLKAEMGW